MLHFSIGSPQLLNYVIAYFALGSVLLGVAVFVYLKNVSHPVNRIFASYSFCIAWWSLFTILLITSTSKSQALFWDQVCLLGAIFIPTTFIHFVFNFLGMSKRFKKITVMCYSFSLCYLFLLYNKMMFEDVVPTSIFNFYTVPNLFYGIFIGYFSLTSTFGVILLYHRWRRAPKNSTLSGQLKWLFFSSLLGYLGGGTNFLLVYGITIPYVTPIANYAILLYGLAVTYIILRYRFLDIEVIIKKTLVFAGLFGMIMAVVGVVTSVMQQVIGAYFPVHPFVSTVLSVTAAILLYDPTKRGLILATDRFLFQKKEDVRIILKQLSQQIITILDINELSKTILIVLGQAMRLQSGAILLLDDRGRDYRFLQHYGSSGGIKTLSGQDIFIQFMRDNKQLVNLENTDAKMNLPLEVLRLFENLKAVIGIPLSIKDQLLGIIFLGAKKSDQEFSAEEIDFFPTLGSQAAIALSNSRQIEIQRRTQIEYAQQAKLATIGTLVAGIGHEVKNPLQVVKNGLDYLLMSLKHGFFDNLPAEELKNTLTEAVVRMQDGQGRVTRIINNISEFSKKRSEVVKEPVDLEKAADIAVELTQYETKYEDIQIIKAYAGNLPPTIADLNRLAEVFFNILNNARDAILEARLKNPDAAGVITISSKRHADEVELAISDTGTGIPNEILESIFDPFFTTKDVSRNPESERPKGSGLGLHLAKSVVEDFGGRILVESQVGKGTTFRFLFPRQKETQI